MQGNSWRLGKPLRRASGGGFGLQISFLESSGRALGGSLSRLGGSWRALGHLRCARGGLGIVLGGAGAVLEAYKRRLERSLGRLGAVLGALEAMLMPSGGQKAPKRVHKEGQNEVQKRLKLKISTSLNTIVFSI